MIFSSLNLDSLAKINYRSLFRSLTDLKYSFTIEEAIFFFTLSPFRNLLCTTSCPLRHDTDTSPQFLHFADSNLLTIVKSSWLTAACPLSCSLTVNSTISVALVMFFRKNFAQFISSRSLECTSNVECW